MNRGANASALIRLAARGSNMGIVLIVDDDRRITDMLRRTLAYEGYDIVTASDGHEALMKAQAYRPDVVVLDWLMPGMDGLEVARRLRAANTMPILMLTARDAIEDRVEGLDSGADDYLVKPFAPAELLARIRALLRRTETTRDGERPLVYADLSLDPLTREARRNDRVFGLSPKEFDLLAYLLRHPRQVLPRERILLDVWGYDFGGSGNVLEVYIGYLRVKTEAGGEPRLIQTMRGVGYVLRVDQGLVLSAEG
ncbi:MAG TPA: response regulator transcription factor [Roseiflexaceae bacterium]|jgi:two-component system response regulator MprA